MPYELAFIKSVEVANRDEYINECCIGGDVVADVMLPSLRSRYGDLSAIEEDWGWFIWFEREGVKLAVDVFCDNPETGEFRIHLTSQIRRFFGTKVADTPELTELRQLVVVALSKWLGNPPSVTILDEKHMPVKAKV